MVDTIDTMLTDVWQKHGGKSSKLQLGLILSKYASFLYHVFMFVCLYVFMFVCLCAVDSGKDYTLK